MQSSEKELLHQMIDSISDIDAKVLLKMVSGLLPQEDSEYEILSPDEIQRNDAILQQMNAGDYVKWDSYLKGRSIS